MALFLIKIAKIQGMETNAAEKKVGNNLWPSMPEALRNAL